MKKQCGNCKYALKTQNRDGDNIILCRRYPQQPSLYNTFIHTVAFNGCPCVSVSWWCGEFEAKEEVVNGN